MEAGGSSSMGVPGASGSGDSPLNGLKFGKKIYFEDVGSAQTSSSSSSSSSSSGAKKGKGTGQGGGAQQHQHQQAPPRCQVEGCGEDLSGEKAYYCRHKVCIMHSKSPKVVVAGLEQRFCQQCSRFHQLPEFDQGKRSCRRRLAGHNERRRKPPPMSSESRYGKLSSSFHDNSGRYTGLLMDFAHPGRQGAARHTWPTHRSGEHMTVAQWPIAADAASPPGRVANTHPHPYVHRAAAGTQFSNQDIPPPPDKCLRVSHSSCALSLLSNQQGTSQLNVRAPVMPPNHFEGNPEAQPAIPASFLGNRWDFKGQEACGATHEVFPQISMAQGTEPVTNRGQFPGELELALQGSRQCVDQGGHEREYLQPGNQMHWSL